jgi:cyclomaltodextrinase / maltogenic alpha-amylase / neopullulanase
MKLRLSAAIAFGLTLAAPAFAADCRPDPLSGRVVYLRGTFNDWRADDETAFSYVCDHYELVARLDGEQSFKVGDEDWAFDFGAAGDATTKAGAPVPLAAKGPALKASFHGIARLTITPGAAPMLLVTDLPAGTPLPAATASNVTDPVALSLAFDSQVASDKSPYGAVTVGTDVAFSLRALPGVDAVTLVVEKRRLEGNYDVL